MEKEFTLESSGKDLEDSFKVLAVNLSNYISEIKFESVVNKSFMFRSKDLKSLLYNYVNRINDLLLNDCFLVSSVQDLSIDMINNDYMLSAVVLGNKVDINNINVLIKNIFNNNIYIKEDKNSCNIKINMIVEVKDEV